MSAHEPQQPAASNSGKYIKYILYFIIFIIIVSIFKDGGCSCTKKTTGSPTTPLVQQGFTLQCLDSTGKVIYDQKFTTPWAGEVCDYFRIIPDEASRVVVTLPGYYINNQWQPSTRTTLYGNGQDPSLPETGQNQPLPTRGFGAVQITAN